MGYFLRHEPCEKCGSSDGKAVYDDNSWHCFVCGSTKLSDDKKEELGAKPKGKNTKKQGEVMEKVKPAITTEQIREIIASTGSSGKGFRKIRDDTYAKFGVRHEYSEEDSSVTKQFYPITRAGVASGYKVREIPKDFYSKGDVGKGCDLFMQRNFPTPDKYIVITEGEIDSLSAYQMLKDYYQRKGSPFEIACVSGTVGKNSTYQIQKQYDFLSKFENIVISYDADAEGQAMIDELASVLPKGKVRVMKMRYKDANAYLEKGADQEFIKDFYDAEMYVPVGVVASNKISGEMRQEMQTPKIPLPPFMHKLQDMMAGGIPLGRIVNLGSASGTGKSTITDEILYYMIFNSPHKMGVVTLESTVGQYGIKLLSRHVSRKIELLDNEVALEFMNSEDILQKEHDLFNDEDGNPRFYLVDDRGSDVHGLQSAIENLVISLNCKVIVLDPIHDVIASLPREEQDKFMDWQKSMVKSHNVTFLNVCHTRKTQGGETAGSAGADLHEEDFMGSSAIYKSGACNLVFKRNKEAEDDIERNTTIMKATKIRWTGKTGVAGMYYYDNETHTLYDLDDWKMQAPQGEII